MDTLILIVGVHVYFFYVFHRELTHFSTLIDARLQQYLFKFRRLPPDYFVNYQQLLLPFYLHPFLPLSHPL